MLEYWPLWLAGSTVAIASLFKIDGALDRDLYPIEDHFEPNMRLMSSVPFICCATLISAGLGKLNASRQGMSRGDRMAAVWHLSNAIWFHLGCDVLSGLFGVMPGLSDCYELLNDSHSLERHHPDRAGHDAIYYMEFVEIFLSLVCFAMYVAPTRKDNARQQIETFLCGLHIAGLITYYLPGLITGHTTHPILTNVDRAIALTWLFVPLVLVRRNITCGGSKKSSCADEGEVEIQTAGSTSTLLPYSASSVSIVGGVVGAGAESDGGDESSDDDRAAVEEEVGKMKVVEIKKELRGLGRGARGLKAELVQQLVDARLE